ncbi:MAG: hypothetical protein ABIL70_08860 [candidate division WOR-3 bacterium]
MRIRESISFYLIYHRRMNLKIIYGSGVLSSLLKILKAISKQNL